MNIVKSEFFKKYPEIKFGLSTAVGGVSPQPLGMNLSIATNDSEENVHKNREIFFGELGIPLASVNFQKQIHSNHSKQINSAGFSGECDATYTDVKNIFLTVSIADCLPVFLYDPVKKVIAGIHAGWRGSAEKIVEKTITSLVKEYSVNPADVIAFMGPCISQEYFEVGPEVGELFRDEVKFRKGEKFHIDLKKENLYQLISSGVKENNIEISPHCTYREKEIFHSYRRDREKSGRMFGVIGLVD
jgi:purine-nucleoside/S-methyl-5'-thioadenosine phosphorylase / adenosine deaminase